MYYFLGREAEADSCYQEAKRVFAILPQKSYSEIAYAFMIEAAASLSINNFKKTYCFCRQALDLLSVMYNGVHADIANCYNTLATTFSATGKDEQALEYINKSIAILEQLYPNGDGSLFTPYTLQATIRFKHFTAEFQKVKALKDSGATVPSLDDFGSEEAFTKALAIYEKFFPNDKDKIEQVIPGLVTVYLLRGAFSDEAAKVQYQEKMKALAAKYPQPVVATLKRFRGEQ
jgi:tetratricopeptide (TPR) repeat protein